MVSALTDVSHVYAAVRSTSEAFYGTRVPTDDEIFSPPMVLLIGTHSRYPHSSLLTVAVYDVCMSECACLFTAANLR